MTADEILALMLLACVACCGFVAGRQSLWDRLKEAEKKVADAEADAGFAKVGRAVVSDAKSCLRMTACVGDAYGYQAMSYITIGKRPRVKITYEVEA